MATFDLARPQLELAAKIVEQMSDPPVVLHGDLLFSLASLAGETNDAASHLSFAQQHLKVRMSTNVEDKDLGMAYAELSVSLSTNRRYEEGLEAGRRSLAIYEKTEDYLRGVYWPHFAIIHQALALIALKRGGEGIQMLEDTIAWREKRFGPNDSEDFRYRPQNPDEPSHLLGC